MKGPAGAGIPTAPGAQQNRGCARVSWERFATSWENSPIVPPYDRPGGLANVTLLDACLAEYLSRKFVFVMV